MEQLRPQRRCAALCQWNVLIVDVELAIENFIEPGAGLLELPEFLQDSDHIFDSLFLPSTADVSGVPVSTPVVRTYRSDQDMYDLSSYGPAPFSEIN